MLVIEVACSTK